MVSPLAPAPECDVAIARGSMTPAAFAAIVDWKVTQGEPVAEVTKRFYSENVTELPAERARWRLPAGSSRGDEAIERS